MWAEKHRLTGEFLLHRLGQGLGILNIDFIHKPIILGSQHCIQFSDPVL